MIKAVIFDMYETLITFFETAPYFGLQMAADTGMEKEKFLKLWHESEDDRAIGVITLEDLLEKIFKENNCYCKEKINIIVNKRIKCNEDAFNHLHSDIIPMLKGLKEKGLLIGLISNCFSEEAAVIKKSILYPFFDAVCLSFHEGIQKPNPLIFSRCIDQLMVNADECLYVGDGGSYELEAAQLLGMKVMQATWYLKEGTTQPVSQKPDFIHADNPLDIVNSVSPVEV